MDVWYVVHLGLHGNPELTTIVLESFEDLLEILNHEFAGLGYSFIKPEIKEQIRSEWGFIRLDDSILDPDNYTNWKGVYVEQAWIRIKNTQFETMVRLVDNTSPPPPTTTTTPQSSVALSVARKATNEEVASTVNADGLEYAIQSHMGAASIEDPVLAAMWQEADDKLNQIKAYLRPYGCTR